MPAVGAGNQVARRDRRDRADRDPLLARGEVRGAADRQGAQQSVDRVLEVADLTHPPQHLGQLFFGIAARAQRIGDLLGERGAGRNAVALHQGLRGRNLVGQGSCARGKRGIIPWYLKGEVRPHALTLPLVCAEKESLILYDWPAQ